MSYRRFQGFNLSPVIFIIIINLMLFVAGLVSGESKYPFGEYYYIITDRFTYYLGLIPHYFPIRPWTILTSMFVHADIGHLVGNMITLFFFGRFFMALVGPNKFLWVYFGGGILGSIMYLLLGDTYSIAFGASGAVYAIAGALVVMMPKLRVYLYFIVPMPLWVVVLVFFVVWSIPGLVSSNVAWQAHLGGLVAGLVAGYFFKRSGRYPQYR